jgi:hypothetical protein
MLEVSYPSLGHGLLPELPDVLELLGSGLSRALPLASARLLLLLLPPQFQYGFLEVVGVSEFLVFRDRDLKFTTPNRDASIIIALTLLSRGMVLVGKSITDNRCLGVIYYKIIDDCNCFPKTAAKLLYL